MFSLDFALKKFEKIEVRHNLTDCVAVQVQNDIIASDFKKPMNFFRIRGLLDPE